MPLHCSGRPQALESFYFLQVQSNEMGPRPVCSVLHPLHALANTFTVAAFLDLIVSGRMVLPGKRGACQNLSCLVPE